jgi:hypothetical protein
MDRRITASMGLSADTIRTLARFISRAYAACEPRGRP